MSMKKVLESGFEESDIVFLAAPVGKGKTRTSIEYCLDNDYSCLLVTAYVSTVLDVINTFPEFIGYYHNNYELGQYTATTYESFQKLLTHKRHIVDDFDVIIIDEYHLLWYERTFRNIHNTIQNYVMNCNKQRILLSATPDIVKEIEDPIWNIAEVRTAGHKSHIRIKSCEATYCHNLKTAINYVKQNDYDVIFYNNAKRYFDFCFHDYELVTSSTLKQKWNEIFDDESNLVKKIYATKCVSTGLNIMNTGDIRIAVIPTNMTVTDLIQFFGRFRRADINVDIFFPFRDTDFIGTESIQKYGNDAGKVAEYKLATRLRTKEHIKEVLKHFTTDINEPVIYSSSDKYEPSIRAKRLFFRLCEVPSKYYDDFIKTKCGKDKITYLTYKDDLYRLPDVVYVGDYNNMSPRRLRTLLNKLGLQAEPIKKNRRIIGYRIIK